MHWQGWFTLAVLAAMLFGLMRFSHLADVLFMAAVTTLGLAGVISPREALGGFANTGMLTVAALFVVAAGLRQSGALDWIAHHMLGEGRGLHRTMARLTAPLVALSAFLNNTTVVAIAMPVVFDWCRKRGFSPSRFLLPVSYASIIGGVCTLIGTSTNLVVHGLMIDHGMKGMSFFEIGYVGVPVALVSFLYLIFITPRILPNRQEFVEQIGTASREYIVLMQVQPDCPFIGSDVQSAGLRQLPGLFLVEVERNGEIISPVRPDERLESDDRLLFAGVVSTIVDLQQIKGLSPIAPVESGEQRLRPTEGRRLCEAVISASSPLVGRGIREANFRTVYDAAVIAVHRNGERLPGKIGDIVLRPGDTLLMQTSTGFVRAHRNDPDFYLVSEVGESEPMRHEKAGLAGLILLAMVLLMALPDLLPAGTLPAWFVERLDQARVLVAFAAAGMMVVLRCVDSSTARRNIEWQVLIVIAASFGIANAIEKTGAATVITNSFVPLTTAFGPIAALAAVYLLVNVLTELITNNAAAALMFPIALSAAARLGVDPRPFAIVVAIAASACFSSPIGYQTHMMVFGPGGYRFSDFIKAGIPMNLLWFITTILIVPYIWPF